MRLKRIINNIKSGLLSIGVKKDKSCVILDSWFGQKYADNPRYLFEYLSHNKAKLGLTHVVWVTWNHDIKEELDKRGYECYMMNSEDSIRYHKIAYYHICNNAPSAYSDFTGEILAKYSYRSKRINLWHGAGAIKNVSFASNDYKKKMEKHPMVYGLKNYLFRHSSFFRNFFFGEYGWCNSYYLATSASEKLKLQTFFNCPDNRIIVSNYPRNCAGIDLLGHEKIVLAEMKKHKYVMLYLPTFRGKDSSFDYTTVAEYLLPILQEKDILWIQKAHSANGKKSVYLLDDSVLTLDTDFDINVLTPYVSTIVTDYSSILADGLYHEKPIILYVPDYNEYVSGERGITKDAEYILSAGVRFFDLKSLSEYICKHPSGEYTESYFDVRRHIWEKECSIAEIWQDIKREVDD